MEVGEQNDKNKCVDQCSDRQPRDKLSETASGVVHQHSHKQVVEGVPDFCGKEHDADKCRSDLNDVGKIDHGERCDHAIDHILAQCTKCKCILDFPRNFPGIHDVSAAGGLCAVF